MLARAQLWWESLRRDPDLAASDLIQETRAVEKAIIQTLHNRAFRRPELSAADPRASAVTQRDYDQETLAKYHENIQPKATDVRDEYVARSEWSLSLEQQVTAPSNVTTLRNLVIELDDLATSLQPQPPSEDPE